jgi:hypothetical protein
MRASEAVRRAEDRVQETWVRVKVAAADWRTEAQKLWDEGNLRQIIIENEQGEEVAKFPMLFGAAMLLIPVFAAVGAFIAVASGCSISLETKKRSIDDGKGGGTHNQ